MFNVWFCTIIGIDEDNYLSLSYDKLIYEKIEKKDIEHNCKSLEKEWGNGYIFDRIDYEQYVRFKNNDKYCLFIEELFDDEKGDEKDE